MTELTYPVQFWFWNSVPYELKQIIKPPEGYCPKWVAFFQEVTPQRLEEILKELNPFQADQTQITTYLGFAILVGFNKLKDGETCDLGMNPTATEEAPLKPPGTEWVLEP